MLIKDYERQRKRELEDKRMREAEEEAKIRAHMQAMAAREETVARLKAAKKEAEQAAFDKIVEETERARADEEEMQRLRDMLWEEEMEAARLREERARAEKVTRSKLEMKAANEQMLSAKREQQALESAEEEKLVKMMLDKVRLFPPVFAASRRRLRRGKQPAVSCRVVAQRFVSLPRSPRFPAPSSGGWVAGVVSRVPRLVSCRRDPWLVSCRVFRGRPVPLKN